MSDRERTTLRVALALTAVALLVVLFLAWPIINDKERWWALGWNLIPNALIAIIAVPIAYLLVANTAGAHKRMDEDKQLARFVVNELQSHPDLARGFLEFHETFRSVDWKAKIQATNASLDVVVYYFDSWVNNHFDSIREFFARPKTRLRVFLPDPNDVTNQRELSRNFPGPIAKYVEKVKATGDRFSGALRQAGGKAGQLEVRFLRHPLGYSAQCFDNRILVLSVFEMYRDDRIGSPAFVIDLQRAPEVARWWEKELAGLERDSREGPARPEGNRSKRKGSFTSTRVQG